MRFSEALNEKKKYKAPETETMKDLKATWKSNGKKQFCVWHHQYITKI